eukprot:351879-Chlamydomonas_euryale.AAC.5
MAAAPVAWRRHALAASHRRRRLRSHPPCCLRRAGHLRPPACPYSRLQRQRRRLQPREARPQRHPALRAAPAWASPPPSRRPPPAATSTRPPQSLTLRRSSSAPPPSRASQLQRSRRSAARGSAPARGQPVSGKEMVWVVSALHRQWTRCSGHGR